MLRSCLAQHAQHRTPWESFSLLFSTTACLSKGGPRTTPRSKTSQRMLEKRHHGMKKPRFERRPQREESSGQSSTPSRPLLASPSRDSPKQHRSKHYVPFTEEQRAMLPKLEPHELSRRLKVLCDEGQLDAAVSTLKNSPRDAQNAPVWNTVIWECLKQKHYQLSYQLYTDMKRRGHSPTTRTYQTMLGGLSRIEDWTSHTKQIKNAHSLYESFQRHIISLHKEKPGSLDITSVPLASYMRILGAAGLYQGMFDVYYDLDPMGPLKPDHLVFTSMFQSLSPLRIPYGKNESLAVFQNASSAKLLWSQMLKASKKHKFTVDSHLVTAAITALSRGCSSDQELAFKIVREYFGLAPSEEKLTTASTLALEPQSFAAVLMLCRSSEKASLAVDFFEQILKRPDQIGGPSIIDRGHIEELMKAHQTVKPPPENARFEYDLIEWLMHQEVHSIKIRAAQVRPAISTYNLALVAAFRTADWPTATKTFDLMTGFHCHDFMDGVESDSPRLDKARPRLPPTAENVSSMLRTAFATENRANMRQALRMVDFFGIKELASNSWREESRERPKSKKAMKDLHFYSQKLATTVVDALAHIFSHSTKGDRMVPQDRERWLRLKAEAMRYLEGNGEQAELLAATKNIAYERH
ncbi:pentatricopeptide repeat-containing protein [Armillaria mellea]|nr:pentatricopeptide repeat-containing protein [Armillaria mellea]